MLFGPNPSPDQHRRGGRTERLANALLADRNRETVETRQSITCAACGRSIIDHGRRCCSPRCEQWLADGNPPFDPHLARKALEVPLRAWTVIAGSPGVVVGSRPYADLLDALSEKRANRRVRGAPGKKSAKPQQIEGVDSPGSPRISPDRQEAHYSLHKLFDAELGALAVRGSDGLLLPDQEWNRRVSQDEVVHFVAKTKVLPGTTPKMLTRCLTKNCHHKAAGETRFCSKACRTAFDDEGEEPRARAQATSVLPVPAVNPGSAGPETARADEVEFDAARPTTIAAATAALVATIASDLTIPDFLKREFPADPTAAEKEAAAMHGAGSQFKVA